jgi:anti-anti-sigma factor
VDIISDGPVLILTGEFDVRSTMEVRTAIYDRLSGGDEDLVIDLTGVSTIDVTALKVLAAATVVASRQGRHLTLRGAGPAVRRMLHLSRLIRAVEVERVGVSA